MHELFPDNELIAIGMAQSMLPNDGLDFLITWQKNYEVSDELSYHFTSAMLRLIVKATSVSPFHMENIRADYLLEAAIQDATNKFKLKTILDYLKLNPEFKDELFIFSISPGGS